jgi:hypothetical protein
MFRIFSRASSKYEYQNAKRSSDFVSDRSESQVLSLILPSRINSNCPICSGREPESSSATPITSLDSSLKHRRTHDQ